MENQNKNNLSRRGFLKTLGASATAAAATLYGCGSSDKKGVTSANAGKASQGKMTMRTVPSTGDRVSLLGFGCMRYPTIDNDPNADINIEMVKKQVDYALANGVNYFDTAPVYHKGQSEAIIGEALSRHPRNSYFIATKMSNFGRGDWTFENSKKIYENSLRNLRTDYIDYMLLHNVGMGGMEVFSARFIDNGVLDFLAAEREAGRIRNLGFSYHGDIAVYDYLLSQHDKYKWDFVQIELNYVDWKFAHEMNQSNANADYLYDELDKRGIPAIIMEPLLGGRLATVPDFIAEKFKQMRPDDSIASWAFRYAGSMKRTLTVLSGMTYMEHLKENIRTYSPLDPVTPEEEALLMQAGDVIAHSSAVPCTACKYCMPCPFGLDIPAIFGHYNKCLNEGNIPVNAQDPDYRRERRAFLIGYDRSVPRLRQAEFCVGCGECKTHCPQQINIPWQMERINTYVEKLKTNSFNEQ